MEAGPLSSSVVPASPSFALVSLCEAKPSLFTVRVLAERFFKEHVDVYLRPSTQTPFEASSRRTSSPNTATVTSSR